LGLTDSGGGAEKPNGRASRTARERRSRPGPLTPEWNPRKREPLRARERPLRANGSVYEANCCGALQREEAEIEKNDFRGARRQGGRRFGTQCSERLHARGEQGWKSGHLEPSSFCGACQPGFLTQFHRLAREKRYAPYCDLQIRGARVVRGSPQRIEQGQGAPSGPRNQANAMLRGRGKYAMKCGQARAAASTDP
jgi:hypothetical protein